MSGRAGAPPYPRIGVGWGGAIQSLLTNKAWFLVGHLAGGAMTNTTQVLGSKEQAKFEACSKSLHSLVQEPELEHGTSDAPSWAKGSGDAWLYLPCLARVGLGLLTSWILGFRFWF